MENLNMIGTLYSQVAKRCYISSDEELIRDRLTNIIKNAVTSVRALIGINSDDKVDFSIPSQENELLINYCFYRWNNQSQVEFETNYIGDIISLRIKYEMKYKRLESIDNG